MSQSFRFLVHTSFQQQLDSFVKTNSGAWSSLITQMRKAKSSPFSGKPRHDIPIKKLQSRIYKFNVKGPGGFRFLYVVVREKHIVLPVYVSLVPKARLDYDKEPWLEYATEIYEDLVNGNVEKFTEFILSH